jgi:RHS repeat-associated protein
VSYKYYANNQLKSMTVNGTEAFSAKYDDNGRLVTVTAPNGTVRQHLYTSPSDPNGVADQLTAIVYTDNNNAALGEWDYAYDLTGGQLTSRTDKFPAAANVASSPLPTTTFDDANQISFVGSTNFKYDKNGSQLNDLNGVTFSYDVRGRLASVTQGANTTGYLVDSFGRRVKKIAADSSETHYIYDLGGHLIAETDVNNVPQIEYIWMGDMPVMARYFTSAGQYTEYLIFADKQNTPRRLVTMNATPTVPANTLRWVWNSDPYGNGAPNQNPANLGVLTFNLRFPGQYADAESGLFYNGARDYNPITGRYVESDPIGLAGGSWSTYAYVNGNPLLYYDPNGLWAWGDPLPQGLVDFSAGFGDTLSFGITNWVRNEMSTNGGVNKCSGFYTAGEYSGVALDIAIGGAAGLEAAGSRGAGMEFSHWIPNRMGGPRSMWNGNYVTTEVHALSDPFRYRFMPKAWKAQNPMPNMASQQWVRIPNVYKGAAAGGAFGAAGAASSSDSTCSH